MTVFRWIIGTLAGLCAAGAVLAFVVFIVADVEEWLKRARNLRRLASASALLWFNVEIWRRVALIIIHW